MNGAVRWNDRQHRPGQILAEAEHAPNSLHEGLVLDAIVMSTLFTPLQPGTQIVKRVLHVCQPGIGTFWWELNWLSRRARLRRAGLLVVVLAVHQGVPASASFDLSQACEVAALEVAVAMLELPQCLVGTSSVEHVALWMVVS